MTPHAKTTPPSDDALPRYFATRFAADADEDAFAQAFSAAQNALADGHTVTDPAVAAALAPPLLIRAAAAEQGASAPLVCDEHHLWLYRIWRAERDLVQHLCARLHTDAPPSPVELDPVLNSRQAEAVRHVLSHHLTLIDGGPGTGKTFTLAHLVRHWADSRANLRLALAAPTGKAAKRMEEALKNVLGATELPGETLTLHRLLGIGARNQAQYHPENPLPFDLIVIDEASMLSLELAGQLFAAVAPSAKLILLGDAHQLAAVDAGAVLHDLCRHPALDRHRITLNESRRFHAASGIGQLAGRIIAGESERAVTLLDEFADLRHHRIDNDTYSRLSAGYGDYFRALQQPAEPQQLLALFDRYRILCASHHGALGTDAVNRYLSRQQRHALGIADAAPYYHGQPLMITANDYRHGLFNGDIGLCLADADDRLRLHLPQREQTLEPQQLDPQQLSTAYALTVHKSQGSEFECVALVLDDRLQGSLLSRELVYTGITRAKTQLHLHTHPDTLRRAVATPTRRSTGLAAFLDKIKISH